MDDIAKVLFGAAAGFVAALVGEHIKRIRASQVAAMMLIRELDFHRQRLDLAIQYDQEPAVAYGLKFDAPIWTAQSGNLLAGANAKQSEALLNWYATLAILGYSIGKQLGPDGPCLIGPDRLLLSEALGNARVAALKLASRSVFWTYRSNQQSLFSEVTK
jgi:hypothetical protein